MRKDDDSRSIPKIVLLVFMLTIVFMSTSVLLAIYPQHLYIDKRTVIDSTIGFNDNNTVNIRGNLVQYSQDDIIPINGKDYVRITGNQVQLGESVFTPAIRIVTAKFYQNILFEQSVGEFNINRAAQVSIEGYIISMIPLSATIINIRTSDSNYNVELTQNITYINTKNGIMLKIQKINDKIKVSIIGIQNYQNVWIREI